MNNSQFRRLLLDTSGDRNEATSATTPGATASSLGAKRSGFMPMTPRAVKGNADVDFARHVRERHAGLQPAKKFKSAVPKGVKYGAGYTDRARARAEADEDAAGDDKAARIQALEEQMKLGQISEEVFISLRDQIAGGDVSSTHLVKGLDRKLLERVRKGEDVLGVGSGDGDAKETLDVDEELDKLVDRDVEAVKKVTAEKKGNLAPSRPLAGVKRSRDELMAELKAQRKAAAETKASSLTDTRWKKVGENRKSRIEVDHKGREVIITVDEDGVVKKKVRKVASQAAQDVQTSSKMPDESKPVLGADVLVPEIPPHEEPEEEDDDDIFEGVGTAYDPLGGDDNDSGVSDEDSTGGETATKTNGRDAPIPTATPSSENKSAVAQSEKPCAPRNYFKTANEETTESNQDRLAGVQELLKKAARMDSASSGQDPLHTRSAADNDEQAARLQRRAQMLANQDRDLDDMDMGFGGSRYDDGEDETEGKVKLSEWNDKDGNDDHPAKGGDHKRKRKPKKRKGDGNSMADIMRVIDGRKGQQGK